MTWLTFAKKNIITRFAEIMENQTNLKPFDAIIFYVACHGTIDNSFVVCFVFLFFFVFGSLFVLRNFAIFFL